MLKNGMEKINLSDESNRNGEIREKKDRRLEGKQKA